MHSGWLATVGGKGNYRRVVMAMKDIHYFGEISIINEEPEVYYFDAFMGDSVEINFPCFGSMIIPIDFNGDGISEFYCDEGEYKGWIMDQYGDELFKFNDILDKGFWEIKNGQMPKEHPCERIMLMCSDGFVRIYGDIDAVGSEIFNFRHSYKWYHDFMQCLTVSGYNLYRSNVTCEI